MTSAAIVGVDLGGERFWQADRGAVTSRPEASCPFPWTTPRYSSVRQGLDGRT